MNNTTVVQSKVVLKDGISYRYENSSGIIDNTGFALFPYNDNVNGERLLFETMLADQKKIKTLLQDAGNLIEAIIGEQRDEEEITDSLCDQWDQRYGKEIMIKILMLAKTLEDYQAR